MASDLHFLRLFPLQAMVLFPGMELPLVVFEPRYLQLTQECTDNDEPFGVLLLNCAEDAGCIPGVYGRAGWIRLLGCRDGAGLFAGISRKTGIPDPAGRGAPFVCVGSSPYWVILQYG